MSRLAVNGLNEVAALYGLSQSEMCKRFYCFCVQFKLPED